MKVLMEKGGKNILSAKNKKSYYIAFSQYSRTLNQFYEKLFYYKFFHNLAIGTRYFQEIYSFI